MHYFIKSNSFKCEMLHPRAKKKKLLEKTLTSIHMENKISLKRQRSV